MTVHTEEKDKRGKELISSQMEFYKMEKMRNDSFFAESKKMCLYQIKANNNESPVTNCTGLFAFI